MKFQVGDYIEVVEMKNGSGESHSQESKYKGRKGFVKIADSTELYPYRLIFDGNSAMDLMAFCDRDLKLVETKTIANKTIGQIKGNYNVLYKNPNAISQRGVGELQCTVYQFEGECENLTANGLCAFRNKEDRMLLVHFNDIVQLSPIN